MYQASCHKYPLHFKEPGGTSRGVLQQKTSWFIEVWDSERPELKGLGECSILPNLSRDDRPGLEQKIQWCCTHINELAANFHEELEDWPALRFALEMAFRDLLQGGRKRWFESPFTRGEGSILINGLIWMGEAPTMQRRIQEKLEAGFSCLKLKIGALNFEEELRLLRGLRRNFSAERLELRVDANGAFSPEEAPGVLAQLADLHIHSIEQPIAAGQWQEMARLCEESPLPIALDEELIGLHKEVLRLDMLNTIRPHFLILKPSLTGGFASSNHWIQLARKMGSDYWVTSALESNVGLNAIAQWTATLNNPLPQGLGTGQVFTNNVGSPLYLQGSRLYYEAGEGG